MKEHRTKALRVTTPHSIERYVNHSFTPFLFYCWPGFERNLRLYFVRFKFIAVDSTGGGDFWNLHSRTPQCAAVLIQTHVSFSGNLRYLYVWCARTMHKTFSGNPWYLLAWFSCWIQNAIETDERVDSSPKGEVFWTLSVCLLLQV